MTSNTATENRECQLLKQSAQGTARLARVTACRAQSPGTILLGFTQAFNVNRAAAAQRLVEQSQQRKHVSVHIVHSKRSTLLPHRNQHASFADYIADSPESP